MENIKKSNIDEPEIVFERKITSKLIEWKNTDNGTSALLIEGARRIGKTTVVREFGKQNYKSFIIVNFSTDEGVKQIFEDNSKSLDDFFDGLSVFYSTPLFKRESLIVFDEVQLYPKAREKIKSLVKDHSFDYIETGSLISLKQNVEGIVIPSEEKSLQMHPLDFEEFLWATGDKTTMPFLRNHLASMKPLDSLLKPISRKMRIYMIVGGMPQSVNEYVKKGSYLSCENKKNQIVSLYRNDIAKFAVGYVARARVMFDSIPAMLSHHDKKIVFSSFGKAGNRSSQFQDTLFWLSESKMVHLIYRVESLDPLYGFQLDDGKVKCYMADTGLLLSLAVGDSDNLSNSLYKSIALGKLSANEGMMMENLACQMLSINHEKLFFFEKLLKNRTKYEVDFVSPSENKFNLYEIKSGHSNKASSLAYVSSKYKKLINKCYILGSSDIMTKNGITYLPLVFASIL
jgi:uncharacterized protein